MRRGYVFAVLAILIVLAGCTGGPGSGTPEPIEASASQATVSDAALSETGYAESSLERVRANRSGTLSIAGDVQMDLTYQVRVTGWRAIYRPPEDGIAFSLYTMPLAKPDNVDARIDPLGDRSLSRIVGDAGPGYDVGDLEHVENRTTTVLGAERVVRQYESTATADSDSTAVTVFVATVEHDTDVVRAVAVVPAGTDAWPTVERLLGGVDH